MGYDSLMSGPYSQAFLSCLRFVREEEGGLSDRSSEEDPGGLTNLGITQATLNEYHRHHPDDIDMPNNVSSLNDDYAARIYHALFWETCRCENLPRQVALVVFNASVQSGPFRATILLQRALGVDQDGIIGPVTLRTVTKLGRYQVIRRFLREQVLFETTLNNWESNKRGWLARLFGAALTAAMLAGCTYAEADLNSGVVRVYTFATSRQDVDIGRDKDGDVHWRAKSSDANADLAAALLNLSKVAVGAATP